MVFSEDEALDFDSDHQVMGGNKDKNKEEIPSPASVTNRDILQRLNFLYQASVLLNGLATPRTIPDEDDDASMSLAVADDKDVGDNEGNLPRPKKSPQKKRRRVVSVEELSRSYAEAMKSVGQKTNVRMDPSVKRRICKRCSAPLVPGISATVRVKDSTSHSHLISYRCHCCLTERRIPAPPILCIDPSTNEDTMEIQASASSMLTPTTPTGKSTHPGRQKRNNGGLKPRLPPHFARDVGHIVFRGNERLDTTHSIS